MKYKNMRSNFADEGFKRTFTGDLGETFRAATGRDNEGAGISNRRQAKADPPARERKNGQFMFKEDKIIMD